VVAIAGSFLHHAVRLGKPKRLASARDADAATANGGLEDIAIAPSSNNLRWA
jgi:hypothetical protein